MASTDDSKNIQVDHDMAADGYMGDKDTLIENGTTSPTKDSTTAIEVPTSYGEVAPLHLDPPKDPKKGNDGLKVIIISCVVFAIGVTVALIVTIYCAPPQLTPHGAVACDDERCSATGVEILKNGGNTMDAAISVLFCLSVVQPESSGIGGGGFMIYRDHKKKHSTTYNFRETAPQTVDTAVLDTNDKSVNKGVFVGVPGYLKGLADAHKSYGQTKWSSLIQPSIELARNGFNVSKTMAYKMKKYIDCAEGQENFLRTFCKEDGTVYKEGDILKMESYASLLERVANEGADILYTGELAQEIVDTANSAGGQMTMKDISDYTALEAEPITGTFKNMSVETVDAPSGGPLVLFALNLLERYGLKPEDNRTALYFHRFIETMKFTNVLYEYLGDPEADEAIKDHVSKIIDPDYAKKIQGKVNDTMTQERQYYVDASGLFKGRLQRRKRRSTHTTHVSIIGPNEDHIAITGSLNSNFGSKLMTQSGILLNDQLSDFSDSKSSSNYFKPGARPLSRIAPTIVHSRGKPCGLRLATGAIGGWTITSEIVQMLVNLLGFSMDITDAVDTPAITFQFNKDFVAFEGFNASIIDDLKTHMGHNITVSPKSDDYFVLSAVMKVNETVSGATKTTRGGVASVF